ncbi:hypothetical protein LU276_09490 [Moraxella haemolytica]|uniref:hypothetical protein n=1 Tax=Moraxella TaxID=475 RepID=UPI002542ABC0|nr:hypothetical protein [Moraxella sp. ZY171148]WII95210.1 hypothetical protein LU276_09490 [Moraxella sp. ZY171148]
MFELNIEQMKMVSGGGLDSSGNNYGDSGNQSLGLPKTDLSKPPSWGALIGGIAGQRLGGTKGMEVGVVIGHSVENFDWEWYRKYRTIAEPYELEYSGGLP